MEKIAITALVPPEIIYGCNKMPDYMGLGKSISRGYGAVKKIKVSKYTNSQV